MRREVAVPVVLLAALALARPALADGSEALPPPPPPPTSAPPAPPPSPATSGSGTTTTGSGTATTGTSTSGTPTSGSSPSGTPTTSGTTGSGAATTPPPPPPPAPVDRVPRSGSWADVGFFIRKTATGTYLALSPVTGTRFQLVGPVWAEGLWGLTLALGIDANGGQQDVAVGDPYLGIDWVHHAAGYTLVAGGGLTLPLAQAGYLSTYAVSEGMRARWDPWIWADQRMAVVAKTHIEFQRHSGLTYGGDLGLGYLFWLGAGTEPGLLDVEVAGEVGYRPAGIFSFGLRATAVAGQPPGSTDLLQLGVEPYIRIHGGGQMYEIRLTLPLDGPYGFGFSPGGVWGIEVGGGIEY